MSIDHTSRKCALVRAVWCTEAGTLLAAACNQTRACSLNISPIKGWYLHEHRAHALELCVVFALLLLSCSLSNVTQLHQLSGVLLLQCLATRMDVGQSNQCTL